MNFIKIDFIYIDIKKFFQKVKNMKNCFKIFCFKDEDR